MEPSTTRGRFPLIRALRPHQWSKNLLLVLPGIAAHLAPDAPLLVRYLLGFAAFSTLASAVYLINDVKDIPHDRLHPTKKHRPIAAGAVSVPQAVMAAAGLIVFSACIATQLPSGFRLLLVAYFVATSAYSLILKQLLFLDVIGLAGLYTLRVFAGAELAGVALSPWFIGFSIFAFLSLALMKRVVELRSTVDHTALPGRGYVASDLPVVTGLGLGAATAAALVFCLYVTSDAVLPLYSRPTLLWAGLPLILYWFGRTWIVANRGSMNDDPLIHAMRDRASWAVAAAMMIVILSAL